MANKIKTFLAGFMSDQVLDYFFWAKIAPPGTAIVAMIAAVMEGMGWAWGMVIMAFMFYLVSGGLYYFDEWRELNRVKGRLQFNGFELGRDMLRSDEGSIIVKFLNRASFPIAFQVKELRVSFNKQRPDSDTLNTSRIVVPPHTDGEVSSNSVYKIGEFKNMGVEGEIEAVVVYGKEAKLKHKLKVRKKIAARFDENGRYVGGVIIDDEASE